MRFTPAKIRGLPRDRVGQHHVESCARRRMQMAEFVAANKGLRSGRGKFIRNPERPHRAIGNLAFSLLHMRQLENAAADPIRHVRRRKLFRLDMGLAANYRPRTSPGNQFDHFFFQCLHRYSVASVPTYPGLPGERNISSPKTEIIKIDYSGATDKGIAA